MCSRRLVFINGQPVLVGRNMDWTTRQANRLIKFPRGMARDGLTKENPTKWVSKYGSVGVTAFECAIVDGMNEKGFAAHILYLAEADYGERDVSKEGLSMSVWAQYFIDTCATVAEAVEAAKKIQVVPVLMTHKGVAVVSPMHLAVEDATGDSAIFEYLEGKLHIHHDRKYVTMTNSPPFEEQLILLKQYVGCGGDKPIPGSPSAEDRFVRCQYYGDLLPNPPENYEMAVAGVLSVMRIAATPWGINDPERPNISATLWSTICDLTNGRYYFGLTDKPNVVWVDLKDLDFSEGAAVEDSKPMTETQYGNIRQSFAPESKPFPLVEGGGKCDMIEQYAW